MHGVTDLQTVGDRHAGWQVRTVIPFGVVRAEDPKWVEHERCSVGKPSRNSGWHNKTVDGEATTNPISPLPGPPP